MTWTALADLTRDIAGDLPAEAFARWEDPSNRCDALAAEILAPFARHGLVVCSDTAGLSKMTSQLPLAVVLKRISEPKERIHAAGTGLGGTAVGIWVADNTEMFYPPESSIEHVTAAMAAIHHEGAIGIGFCLHVGVFYAIGGGLYGPDADRVEILAEDHASGGETLLTPEARAALGDSPGFRYTSREEHGFGVVFEVESDRNPPPTKGSTAYPLPYDEPMNQMLLALDEENPGPELETIDRLYRSEQTVLLVERHHRRPVADRVETVDALLADVRFQQVTKPLLQGATPHWTVSGSLALAAFAETATAIDTAMALRVALGDAGLTVTCGIDRGDVYLFPMGDARHEFAGDPVNRASKMAEDLASPGDLCVSARAAIDVDLPQAEPVRWSISGIAIEAFRLR